MPTTLVPDGDIATLDAGDAFSELVCADEELVRAEFDALIAAVWSGPPEHGSDQPDGAAGDRRTCRGRPPRDRALSLPSRPQGRADRWTRQRSPPKSRP